MKRRAFFGKTIASILGGFALGNLVLGFFRSKFSRRIPGEHVAVKINPIAVARTKKESKSHAG